VGTRANAHPFHYMLTQYAGSDIIHMKTETRCRAVATGQAVGNRNMPIIHPWAGHANGIKLNPEGTRYLRGFAFGQKLYNKDKWVPSFPGTQGLNSSAAFGKVTAWQPALWIYLF